MYNTKKEVDKHVSDILAKAQNETEKNLKGFPIARLYFQVKDYEMSKRYLASYLSVRETHSPSHKLMGQIMEALGNQEVALQSYKRSLDIDVHQKDLVLKICELYCNLPVDPDTARYWADRGDQLFPHHEVIFRLRECIVNAEGEPNVKELEQLITTEMNSRPKDVNLYTKLLKLYTDTERVEQAYMFAAQVETTRPFPHSIDWYYCLADIFEVYHEENPQLQVRFCLEYFVVLDHLCTLLLAEPHAIAPSDGLPSKHGRSVADAAAVLHTLDKLLHRTSLQTSLAQDPSWNYVKNQMHGQLYLHLGTLLLKRAKKERANWKEACRYSSALYLLAYTFKPGSLLQEAWYCKMDSNKQLFLDLHQKGFLRLSHAGHVLMSMCSASEERAHWLQKVKQETCVPQAQEKIFQRAFSSLLSSSSGGRRGQAQNAASRQGVSFFLQDGLFLKASLQFPTDVTLLEYDRVSNKVYPFSLHHLVWLSVHWLPTKRHSKIPKFQLFERLQLSSALVNSGAPESFCQLDADAFLSATVFTAWGALEMRGRIKTPGGKAASSQSSLLGVTPDICDPLCTPEQAAWWRAAYHLYSNTSKEKLGELRQTLRRGLETIRGVGAHGMEISLVIHLARHFAQQAQLLRETLGNDTPSEEVSVLEERATHYWNLALIILDKLQMGNGIHSHTINNSHQRGSSKHAPLFASFHPELSVQEVLTLTEEGRFYLACRFLNTGCLEEAVEAFSKLNSAEASHHQATALVELSQKFGQAGDGPGSPDGDVRTGLLARARDALYLTLDRIANDKRHPLNLQLHEEIEAVEYKLAHSQDNGVHDGSDEDGLEEEGNTSMNTRSIISPIRGPTLTNNNSLRDMLSLGNPSESVARSLNLNNGSILDSSLTSNGSFRPRLRPSPERLDAQIRALSYNQCGVVQLLLEQQRTLMETNKAIVEELKQNKTLVEELKKKLDEIQTTKCTHAPVTPRPPPVMLPPQPQLMQQRSLVQRTRRSAQQAEDDHEEFEETGHPDPNQLYDYSLDAEEAFDYNSYLHDPRSASNMGYAMMMQYPAHYAQPPHLAGAIPPQAMLNQRAPTPRNCYPGYGSALTFSEGQQLPQFNFRMPPPAAVIPPMAGISPAPDNRASVFNRLGPNSGMAPMWDNQAMQAPPPPPQDMQWNAKMGNSAPNAFQIPLPAANMPSDQPPAVLSSMPVLPGFMSPQFPPTPVNSQMLKGMLTGTPGFTPSPAAAPQRSPLETFQGFAMTPGNTSGVSVGSVGGTPSAVSGQKEQGNSDNEDVDYDFKPAIPLPDEVAVCTGEEHESVIFEQRAKLFRFTEKEWKERGVGILKILLDKTTGKTRLLMRRDQVLKVCANHHILSNMTLQPMRESDRAWIWAAKDFAEENLKEEKFCVRFKTQELAFEFRKAFEASVEREIRRLKTAVASPKVSETTVTQGFGDKFKPVSGSWSCDACLVNNKADVNRCVACETPKLGAELKEVATPAASKGFTFGGPPVAGGGFAGLFQVKASKCSKCKVTSVAVEGEVCLPCKGTPAFGSVPIPSAAKVGGKEEDKNIFGGFTFTTPPIIKPGSIEVTEEKPTVTPSKPARPIATAISKQKDTPTNAEKNNSSPFGAFQFALKSHSKETAPIIFSSTPVVSQAKDKVEPSRLFGQSSIATNLTFDSISTTVPVGFKVDPNFKGFPGSGKQLFAVAESPGAKDVSKENVEDFIPSAEFQPVIPLPELVDIKTGEEEEEKLFSERAKLFRFVAETKEWKERGLGDVKILKNPKTNRCRVLMRREQVLKLCANHSILAEMKLDAMPSSDRAWVWFAQDYSEGEMKQERFAIKFKNKDIALKFKQVFEQCQLIVGSPESSVATTNPTQPATPLSTLFKPKEGSWSCPTCLINCNSDVVKCPACQTDKPGSSSPTKPAVVKSLSAMFKQEEGTWNCTACYLSNKKDVNACVACSNPKAGNATSTEQAKFPFAAASSFQSPIQKPKFQFGTGNLASNEDSLSNSPFNTFKIGNQTESAVKPTAFTFGSSQGTDSESFSSFKFGSTNDGSAPAAIPGHKTPPPSDEAFEFKFGSPQKFEFSFSGVRPRSPSKTPKSPGIASDAEKDGTEEESETSDADIFFQPVIPLPQKVDVKTGEEDEEVLYCHRAKLFRHDQGEWKERGTGDIKILRDNRTDKIRLLMRREQVLKVCLNHLLASDLELVSKGEKSWFWSAMDYSEGSPNPEQLALRFKNKEVADGFKQAVEDAKAYLTTPKSSATHDQEVPVKEVPEVDSPAKTPPESPKTVGETPTTPTGVTAESFSFVSSSNASPSFGLAARFGVNVSPGNAFVFGNAGTQQTSSPRTTGTSYVFGSSSLTPGNSTTAENEGRTPVTQSEETPVIQSKESKEVKLEEETPSLSQPKSTNTVQPKKMPVTQEAVGKHSRVQEGTSSLVATEKLTGKGPVVEFVPRGLDQQVTPQVSKQDVAVLFEKHPTPEQVKRANDLMLPETFFLYEDSAPCAGCRGCPPEEDLQKDVELVFAKQTSTEQIQRARDLMLPDSFYLYEDAPPCPGCRGCWKEDLPNKAPATPVSSNEKPAKDEKMKATIVERFRPPILDQQSPLFPTSKPSQSPPRNIPQSEASQASSEVSSSTATLPNLLFGAATTEFSFATLATQSLGNDVATPVQSAAPNEAMNKNILSGFKKLMFSGYAETATPMVVKQDVLAPKENGDDSDDVVQASVDVHFDPLVPLPELVEVNTGEEEETAIFSHRAKLYRYNSELKQWKERGVGEMKILKHHTKCQFRLLLRRDQVLKIACNHLVSPTLELKPLTAAASNSSLMWSALDFSEEVLMAETFCIRFQNKDLLEQFQKTVEACKESLIQNENPVCITELVRPDSLENVAAEDVKHDGDSEEVEDEEYEDEEDEEEEEEVPEWAQEEIHLQPGQAGHGQELWSTGVFGTLDNQSLHVEGEEVSGQDEREELDHSEEAEEEEDEDDEEQLMFEKRITLAVASMDSKEYQGLGMGTLRILYDDTVFGGRIQVTDDNAQLMCDHFIAVQTCLRVVDKEATWAAADMSLPQTTRRQFKANFSSKVAAQDFQKAFDEAKHLSVQSEIVENEDPTPNFN